MSKLALLQGLAGISSMLVVTLTLGSLYAIYFEDPYLAYTNMPFPQVNNELIVPGTDVYTFVSRCSASGQKLQYASTRFAISEETLEVIEFPPTPAVVMPGCRNDKHMVTRLPLNMLSGRYHFYGTTTVAGTFMTHNIEWTSQSFTVYPLGTK